MTSDFINGLGTALRFETYSDLVENLYLKALIESFTRLRLIPGIGDLIENQIRNQLAYDLENNNNILRPYLQNKIVKLTKENTLLPSPTRSNRTDIEFFISFLGDFVVECKNLSSAEQRYINDGVNRFISGQFSSNDSEAAMIGFIVGGGIPSIKEKLYLKVENESSAEKNYSHSQERCSGYEHSFHSLHTRPNKKKILIHHLFVDLVSKN